MRWHVPLHEPVRCLPGASLISVLVVSVLMFSPVLVRCSSGQSPDESAKANVEPQADADAQRAFLLRVVGPQGDPVPGAQLDIRATPKVKAVQIERGNFVREHSYGSIATADDAGELSLVLPKDLQRISIGIKQVGYGPYWVRWETHEQLDAIPNEFTAELDAGWSVGGIIVDGDGKPVDGASVHPSVYYKKPAWDTRELGVGTRVETDPEGKWRFDFVPASSGDVHVAIDHPDFQPRRLRLSRDIYGIEPGATPVARIALERGLTVTGTVTDEAGQPIEGALVRTEFLNEVRESKTDASGVYRLKGCEPRMTRIVVSAPGRALDLKEVRVDRDLGPVNFTMKPGGHVRIRVVDAQGNGIPKARIFFQRWRGRIDYFEFDHVDQYTDENGIWEWNEAPLDEFKADICHPTGMQLSKQSLISRDEEYVFQPPPALVVSGSVVDAKTKQPIPKFRVIPGLRNEDPSIGFNWIPQDRYTASDGKYRIRLKHDYPAHLVRIEAAGYKVSISRDIQTDEGDINVDFQLQPADDIAATILTAAGNPAGGARIALGVAGSQINIDNGEIDDGSTYATRIDADPAGHFSLPARDEPFQLVITHAAGFAHLKSSDGPIPERIRLTPWARAEGTFRVGKKPAANVVLTLSGDGIHSYGDDVPNIFCSSEVTTGEDGGYRFERVFPGRGWIGRNIKLTVSDGAIEVTSSARVSEKFTSGETTRLDLGGSGRAVIGTLVPHAGHSERVLWNFALIQAVGDVPRPPTPEALLKLRDDPVGREAWLNSDEGKEWKLVADSYQQARDAYPYITATIDHDGSFRIDDVPPGNYLLSVRFEEHWAGELRRYPFIVQPAEDADAKNEPLDLGVIQLESP